MQGASLKEIGMGFAGLSNSVTQDSWTTSQSPLPRRPSVIVLRVTDCRSWPAQSHLLVFLSSGASNTSPATSTPNHSQNPAKRHWKGLIQWGFRPLRS